MFDGEMAAEKDVARFIVNVTNQYELEKLIRNFKGVFLPVT